MKQQTAVIDKSHLQSYTSSYREVQIGDTLYRVTSFYKGEITLKEALEELTVQRVLREFPSVSVNASE